MKKVFVVTISILVILIAAVVVTGIIRKQSADTTTETTDSGDAEKDELKIIVDGNEMSAKGTVLNENDTPYFPREVVRDAFCCSINLYDNSFLVMSRGNKEINIGAGATEMTVKTTDSDGNVQSESVALDDPMIIEGTNLYVTAEIISKGFDFTYSRDGQIYEFTNNNPDISAIPEFFSCENEGTMSVVKNQGNFGACWAFASLGAIECSLLPEESWDLSEDHMLYCNSFTLDASSGGDYFMAAAYLTSWQGPVNEADDPYGDGATDDTLSAVLHTQEIQFLTSGDDFEEIKEMIYKYGAVESSLFISADENGFVDDTYYNIETCAYCFDGESDANHEIVIIGWDDNYPKENFNGTAESDGAFICKNSWGSNFGNDGIFYVSYCDSLIGRNAIIYTRVDDADNYDNIYQYDLCGWVGIVGYDSSSAYMANVFTAESDESLKAVSFYATGDDTTYRVYVCSDFSDASDINVNGKVLAEGTLENTGYYTIDLDEAVDLTAGKKFAVCVEITTPGKTKPVAVETVNYNRTGELDFSGDESYVSSDGKNWQNAQESSDCSVCLKAFTVNR